MQCAYFKISSAMITLTFPFLTHVNVCFILIPKFLYTHTVANPVLTFFVIWVAYRFGDIKLGAKDDEPEFSNASYFSMIFSAGVGVGLFFYGVSEPLWHREPGNYYSNAGYHSQNEIDQWSLVITM